MAKQIAVIFVMLTLTACSTSSNAPFHIYNSPLLNAQNHPSQRKSREYDPFDSAGDHNKPKRVYAVGGDATPAKATKVAAKKATPKKSKYPTLSTVGKMNVGGTQSEALSSASKFGGSYEPPVAAAYIWDVYKANGVEFGAKAKSSIPALYKECKAQGKVSHDAKPQIGDLVFFHNVLDANEDGRNNDWYTHVAVVESVDSDGTVTARGYAGGAVSPIVVNLTKPADTHVGSKEINSRLRDSSAKDAPFTQYFASQLFAGYCSALGDKSEFIAVDNWSKK